MVEYLAKDYVKGERVYEAGEGGGDEKWKRRFVGLCSGKVKQCAVIEWFVQRQT